MKIFSVSGGAKYSTQIYVFNESKELESLQLNPAEKAYCVEQMQMEQDIIALQRLPQRLFLVRLSAKETPALTAEAMRRKGNRLCTQLQSSEVYVEDVTGQGHAVALAEGLALGSYQFNRHKTKQNEKAPKLEKVHLANTDENSIAQLNAGLEGVFLARDLVNEPLNHLNAEQLAQAAADAGKKYGFKTEILNKSKLEALKMGGILSVNRGSQDPPTFTIAEYKPDNAVNSMPIVLVGKGVVYDTGGMSLKPTAGSMDSMKCDMAGAAAVIGTMSAVAGAQLPVHVIGLIPATDNRPGENAYVPGDIITMYNGSTVEVLNTDAEGRLLLADALAYAKQYNPQLVFDLATLTGSAVIAIGKQGVVAMGTAADEDFEHLAKAGHAAHERIAPLPFWEEYSELLKSPVADVKNIGGREAGSITAGKFLERFTDYPWIHLDIAGPAFLDANDHYRLRGGTGVGVRLLFEYFKNLV